MERRKIQKVGSSTLSISLPKEWTNNNNVKPGDMVYLDSRINGSLQVLSESFVEEEKKPRTYSINCDFLTSPNILERLIVGNYILGVDIIKIFSSRRINGEQIDEICNIVQRLIGLSVIEMSSKEIILQCSLDPTSFNIYPLLRRLTIITCTMLEESTDALLNNNIEYADNVIDRENEANNIYWLITRLLHSNLNKEALYKEQIDPTSIRLISKNLERIADCSEQIAKTTKNFNKLNINIKEKSKNISNLIQLSIRIFEKTIDSLFLKDLEEANEAINLREKFDQRVETETRTTQTPYFQTIATMLSMIAENSASIATIAINREISKLNSYPYMQKCPKLTPER
jgi:phosphate uptake regulator